MTLSKSTGDRCGNHTRTTKSNSDTIVSVKLLLSPDSWKWSLPPQHSVNILFNVFYWLMSMCFPVPHIVCSWISSGLEVSKALKLNLKWLLKVCYRLEEAKKKNNYMQWDSG